MSSEQDGGEMNQDSDGTEQIEVGECPSCGEVESDGEFEFEYGPRCPRCNEILQCAWLEDRPASDGIMSDTTASDYIPEELR